MKQGQAFHLHQSPSTWLSVLQPKLPSKPSVSFSLPSAQFFTSWCGVCAAPSALCEVSAHLHALFLHFLYQLYLSLSWSRALLPSTSASPSVHEWACLFKYWYTRSTPKHGRAYVQGPHRTNGTVSHSCCSWWNRQDSCIWNSFQGPNNDIFKVRLRIFISANAWARFKIRRQLSIIILARHFIKRNSSVLKRWIMDQELISINYWIWHSVIQLILRYLGKLFWPLNCSRS